MLSHVRKRLFKLDICITDPYKMFLSQMELYLSYLIHAFCGLHPHILEDVHT